jgi:hypothetical protein
MKESNIGWPRFSQDMEKLFVTCGKKKWNRVVSTCRQNIVGFLNFPTCSLSDL